MFLFSAVVGALGWGLGLAPTLRAADEAADKEKPALITVNVPQDAQIWFEGAKTSQEGTSRQFISPALKEGHSYTYNLRVRRWENGRNVDETRKLSVHAGENITVTFGGNLQTNYYYSPAAPSSPNGITYRNYYPSYYAPTYYYDSGYYPGYSPSSHSGPSPPSWSSVEPHRPLSD
jgi:uncharacterized protein (TIGR03000 family)